MWAMAECRHTRRKPTVRCADSYQRWSNCQERWTHVGNYTGVGSMNYTSSKKLYR